MDVIIRKDAFRGEASSFPLKFTMILKKQTMVVYLFRLFLLILLIYLLVAYFDTEKELANFEQNEDFHNELDGLQPIISNSGDYLVSVKTSPLKLFEKGFRDECFSGGRRLVYYSTKSFDEIEDYYAEQLTRYPDLSPGRNPYHLSFGKWGLSVVIANNEEAVLPEGFLTAYTVNIRYGNPGICQG